MAAFFAEFGSTMEVEEFSPISVAANDSDVLTVVRFRARSRATGKTAAMDLHHYFAFRDGKIAYYRGTEDTAQTQAVLPGLTRVSGLGPAGVVRVPARPGGLAPCRESLPSGKLLTGGMMRAVWLVLVAGFRRQWRSWVLLGLLIAVASGFVLASTAGGSQTRTPTAPAARAPRRPQRRRRCGLGRRDARCVD